MAADRGHEEIVELLDPVAAAEAEARRKAARAIPDYDSDPEPEPDPSIITGHVIALDHIAQLDASLCSFDWASYEANLAKVAGIPAYDVLVTPEPGSKSIEAHATVLVRLPSSDESAAAETAAAHTSKLPAARGPAAQRSVARHGGVSRPSAIVSKTAPATSGSVDVVMKVIQALRKRAALERAAGGVRLLGAPQACAPQER